MTSWLRDQRVSGILGLTRDGNSRLEMLVEVVGGFMVVTVFAMNSAGADLQSARLADVGSGVHFFRPSIHLA